MKKHSEIDMVVWWGMLPHVQEHAREQLDTSLTPCKAAGACASLLGGSSRVAIQPSAVLSTYSECVGHACFPYSASCTRVGAVQGASPRALFFFSPSPLWVTARARHSTLASVLRPMQARHRGAPHGQVQSPIHPRLIRHVSAAGRGQWSGQETCLGARPV